MPHIKKELRAKYKDVLLKLPPIESKGDLEYCIAVLQSVFMSTRDERYSSLHDCVYATYHAAHEFERTFLDVREDKAAGENGSAYDLCV